MTKKDHNNVFVDLKMIINYQENPEFLQENPEFFQENPEFDVKKPKYIPFMVMDFCNSTLKNKQKTNEKQTKYLFLKMKFIFENEI